MEQYITITPNVVSYFEKSLNNVRNSVEKADFQICYELLNENYIAIDSNKQCMVVFKNIIDSIENEFIRKDIENVLLKLFESKSKITDHILDNTKLQYLKLCDATEDKLFLDPDLTDENIIESYIELSRSGFRNLELYNLNLFINPGKRSRLNHKTTVSFFKNEKYNISEILKPFIRNSSYFKLIDNYAANKDSMIHLKQIINCLNSDTKKEIITFCKEDYVGSKMNNKKAITNYSEFEKFIKSYNIELKFMDKGHTDRYIETDNYNINISGGLDQFYPNGMPKINNENKKMNFIFIRK